MFDTLLQAGALLLSAVIGARAAHQWQQRSSRDARFFDASKETYAQMFAATNQIIGLIGRRVYASQRVCLVSRHSERYNEILAELRTSVEDWNNSLLLMDLNVRSLFDGAKLSDFEGLQSQLASTTNRVTTYAVTGNGDTAQITNELQVIRYQYFLFVQQMLKEARLLYRQMHFGVELGYSQEAVKQFSTRDLIKTLLGGRVDQLTVIRPPSDLGQPILISEARFGIHEH